MITPDIKRFNEIMSFRPNNLTLLIIKIVACLGLFLCVIFVRPVIQKIKIGEQFKPRLTLTYEGIVAGGLMGGIIGFGLILSNCYNQLAIDDPNFVRNQVIVGCIFISIGSGFGSIRGLNKR